jgi:hypothetical protein
MDAKRRRWVQWRVNCFTVLPPIGFQRSREVVLHIHICFPKVGCFQLWDVQNNKINVVFEAGTRQRGSGRFGSDPKSSTLDTILGYVFSCLRLVISRRRWVASNDRPHHMTFKVSALVTCYVQHRPAADGIGDASEESAQKPGA